MSCNVYKQVKLLAKFGTKKEMPCPVSPTHF